MEKGLSKKSIGTISEELKKKAPLSRDPIEIEREMHKEYAQEVEKALLSGKKAFKSDFYLVVLVKKERLMSNVYRNYFITRSSCPTPEWDQTLYKYIYNSGTLDFFWTIPSKETCSIFTSNILDIDPLERDLLQFVLDYEDGTLFRLAKKLNGEEDKTPLLKK